MKKFNYLEKCSFLGTKLCYADDEKNTICKYPKLKYDCSTGLQETSGIGKIE